MRLFNAASVLVTLPGVLALSAISTGAEDLGLGLRKCAVIRDSLQRLVCYDNLAKNADSAPVTSPAQPVVSSSSASSSAPRSTATSTARCQATTQKGAQCKRTAKPGSSYCWQHGG